MPIPVLNEACLVGKRLSLIQILEGFFLRVFVKIEREEDVLLNSEMFDKSEFLENEPDTGESKMRALFFRKREQVLLFERDGSALGSQKTRNEVQKACFPTTARTYYSDALAAFGDEVVDLKPVVFGGVCKVQVFNFEHD